MDESRQQQLADEAQRLMDEQHDEDLPDGFAAGAALLGTKVPSLACETVCEDSSSAFPFPLSPPIPG